MSAERLRLTLITPRRYLQLEAGDLLVLPTKSGEMGVMRHHVPTVVSVVPGSLRYRLVNFSSPESARTDRTGSEPFEEVTWLYAFVSAGYAEVGPDQVTVVVTAAEMAADIDVDRARRALQRAEARMGAPTATARDKQHGKHAIRRAKQRIHVADRYGDRPGGRWPVDLLQKSETAGFLS